MMISLFFNAIFDKTMSPYKKTLILAACFFHPAQ